MCFYRTYVKTDRESEATAHTLSTIKTEQDSGLATEVKTERHALETEDDAFSEKSNHVTESVESGSIKKEPDNMDFECNVDNISSVADPESPENIIVESHENEINCNKTKVLQPVKSTTKHSRPRSCEVRDLSSYDAMSGLEEVQSERDTFEESNDFLAIETITSKEVSGEKSLCVTESVDSKNSIKVNADTGFKGSVDNIALSKNIDTKSSKKQKNLGNTTDLEPMRTSSKSGRPLRGKVRHSFKNLLRYDDISDLETDSDDQDIKIASKAAAKKKTLPTNDDPDWGNSDDDQDSETEDSKKRKWNTDESDAESDSTDTDNEELLDDELEKLEKKKYQKRSKIQKKRISIKLGDYTDKYTIENYKSTHQQHRGHDVIETLFKCLICDGFKAAEEEYFRIHIERHVNGDLRCPHCSFEAVTKPDREKHMREVHGDEKKFICDMCGFSSREKISLRNHMGIAHGILNFACTLCPAKLGSRVDRTKHYASEHTKEKKYCKNCNSFKNSLTEEEYEKHLATCSPTVVCDECGSVFPNKGGALGQHKLCAHSNVRKHPCNLCSFSAKQMTVLRRHMKIHEGMWSYP